MLELFEWPPVRSQRVKWVLEEIGLPYESHLVDLPARENETGTYREIHPLGVVPAIRTDAYTMYESVAIVLQLIDEHPECGLAPPPGSPDRAFYYQWSVFSCAEIDPAVMAVFDNTMRPLEYMHPPGTPHDPKLAEKGHADFARRAEILSVAMNDREYLLGDEFSGADILIGHSCFMAQFTGLLSGFPVLESYYARLQQRPAFQRAYPG